MSRIQNRLFDAFPTADMKIRPHALHAELEAAVAAVVVLGAALLTLDLGAAAHETGGCPAAVLVPGRVTKRSSVRRR